MADATRQAPFGRGLTTRILCLTVIFVLLGEILIYLPSIARFRITYLEQRIAEAHLATLALRDRPSLDRELEDKLLSRSGTLAISLGDHLMLGQVPPVDRTVELGERGFVGLVVDALETLWYRGERILRVRGPAPMEAGTMVEVILPEAPAFVAMVDYSRRILALTLFLSVTVAALLFMSLRSLIVRPLSEITEQLARFRTDPEDAGLEGSPSARRDEIGIVDREMHAMQRDLRLALSEKTRLAALGEAMSKINHDLRNMLASAFLISDRLERSADPEVRRITPRLLDALERAIRLCGETLTFARSRSLDPQFTMVPLRPLVEQAAATAGLDAEGMRLELKVDPRLAVIADRDQLFRVFLNLMRNAAAASGAQGRLLIDARRTASGRVEVAVEDNGSGIPQAYIERLFEPFAVHSRSDGSGLGLAICREIMAAHGGRIELRSTGPEGTVFVLVLPRSRLLARAA